MTDQPADQAALRGRIAAALAREDAHNAGYDHGFVSSYGADEETDGFVDAVLAVLPEPTDQAAVLREAAGRYEEMLAKVDTGQDPRYWTAVRDITLGLRRLADDPPLSPYYSHPECGFHWHGRDDMDIPTQADGQPVCPRCELRRLTEAQPDAHAAVLRAVAQVWTDAGLREAEGDIELAAYGRGLAALITPAAAARPDDTTGA